MSVIKAKEGLNDKSKLIGIFSQDQVPLCIIISKPVISRLENVIKVERIAIRQKNMEIDNFYP
jgi:hypothetical protein